MQLFSLFEANPQLTRLIVDICATAPALAQHLSQHPGVLDAVLAGDFFSEWPGVAELQDGLTETMEEAPDYEEKLDAARRWMKEWHFRIGVHHLRGLIGAVEAGQQYAELAEAVLAALWRVVCEEFSGKHGTPPGRGAAVVGMGSLGAARLNATSDLDLIVIYEAQDAEQSEGRRPLATRTYYARLTQALVTAVSVAMAEGRLYEVDMRLRPTGRSGPIATPLDGFEQYHAEKSWTFEHMAMTRARIVFGDAALVADLERAVERVLTRPRDPDQLLHDVADMRRRMAKEHGTRNLWALKQVRGGLVDVDFIAQYMLSLIHI